MKGIASAARQQKDVSWLIESVSRILRPMIRFIMGRVSCKALLDIVREVYVAEAQVHLEEKNPGQPVTNAALAALSGLDSRAIKSIQERSGRNYRQADLCVEANILEMWAENPLFQDEGGQPAELNVHGPNRTFQGLVWRAAGRAVTPQTVLEDLVRNGNVELTPAGDRVRLLSPVYSNIRPSEQTAIASGSLALFRLGSTIAHNTRRSEDEAMPAWLQQDRWSTDIPGDRVDRIRAEIRAVLEKHIAEVEDCLSETEIRPPRANQHSVGVGWYYWEISPEQDAGA